jgi:hypothetical protein
MKHKITLLLVAVFTTVVSAQTVSISGTSYNTITEAITAASNGDIIDITGVHTESIDVSKSITLRGTNPSTDIIQASAEALTDGQGSNVINIIRADDADVLTVSVENLGIRHGNASSAQNGGGINVDKVTGLLSLNNLIIEDNFTSKNGGGISIAGSNVNVINCTIRNNSSSLDGGGIIATPNNGAAINNTVNIKQSLVNSNIGRNGGGVYINGNIQYGDQYTIDFNIENSTISNNDTTSGAGGAGGGAIWCKVAQLVGGAAGLGNINLKLVHATLYNNLHASAVKNGLRFTGPSGVTTNFSMYNSIVVTADDASQKVINFANAKLTNMVNSILGGLEEAASSLAIIDDAAKNNKKGKTATFAGLTNALSDDGGKTQVLAIDESSNSNDYCTAETGITLPNIDQRGATREGTPDAGAYEFGGVLALNDFNMNSEIKLYPNPAKELVHIKGVDQISKVKIYSIMGVLQKTTYGKDYLDISDLSSGVYLFVIENSTSLITKRLVVN